MFVLNIIVCTKFYLYPCIMFVLHNITEYLYSFGIYQDKESCDAFENMYVVKKIVPYWGK